MRSMTAAYETAKNKTAIKPVWLLELDAGGSTYYWADREIDDETNTYDARILSWANINGINERTSGGGTLSRLRIRVIDLPTSVSSLIRIGNTIRLYSWVEDESLGASDRLQVFEGTITDPINVTLEVIEFTAEGLEVSKNATVGELLTTDEYPGADPDDIGKTKPIVYGTVKGNKCLAIDAGTVTNLAVDITASSATIEVTDTSALPSSGTVQIDNEEIDYTGISGNNLTGCTRGANGTNAVLHDKGSTVAEVQSQYDYLVADHAVTQVDAVYVDDVRQTKTASTTLNGAIGSSDTTITVASTTFLPSSGSVIIDSERISYTGTSGNDLTGCTRGENGTTAASHSDGADVDAYDYMILVDDSGQAKISFTARPIISKQVDISINDTIAVNDTTHSHSTSGNGTTSASVTGVTGFDSNPNRSYIADGNASTEMTIGGTNNRVSGNIQHSIAGGTSGKTLVSFNVRVKCAFTTNGSYNNGWVKIEGKTFTQNELVAAYPGYVTKTVYNSNWANLTNMDVDLKTNSWGTVNYLELYEVEVTSVTYSTSGTVSPSASGVTKSGTVDIDGNSVAETVIGKVISCDLIGYNKEKPHEVIEHLLLNYGNGVSAGDLASSITSDPGYSTNYNIGVSLDQQNDLMTLCRQIAWQVRSRFFWDSGLAHLVLIPETSASSVKSLGKDDVRINTLRMRWTRNRQIVNKISATYDYRQDKNTYVGVYEASDATSISTYGTRDQSRQFRLKHVRDNSVAQNVIDTYITKMKEPKRILEFETPLTNIELQRGDVFDMTHDIDGGMVGNKFEIMETNIMLGSGAQGKPDMIGITAEEL